MGARGPSKKAGSQGHSLKQGPSLELVKAGAKPKAPTMPPGLCAEAKRAWRDYWKSDIAQAAVDADLDIVRSYVEAVHDYYTYRKLGMKMGVMQTGSTGQPKMNDLLKSAVPEASKRMRDLAALLGISPMNRARLGINIGAAQMTVEQVNAMARGKGGDTDQIEAGTIEDIEDAELAEWAEG